MTAAGFHQSTKAIDNSAGFLGNSWKNMTAVLQRTCIAEKLFGSGRTDRRLKPLGNNPFTLSPSTKLRTDVSQHS
jgi:hypothetical protein